MSKKGSVTLIKSDYNRSIRDERESAPPPPAGSAEVRKCPACRYWRDRLKNKKDGTGRYVPSGWGECMLMPPTVLSRQGAVDRNETWAGTVTSVIEPGVIQARPTVGREDFCSKFEPNSSNSIKNGADIG